MIYYPNDYVIITEMYYQPGKSTSILCTVADNRESYDDRLENAIPVMEVGENFGWWESSSNLKKVSPEENPEYFL